MAIITWSLYNILLLHFHWKYHLLLKVNPTGINNYDVNLAWKYVSERAIHVLSIVVSD